MSGEDQNYPLAKWEPPEPRRGLFVLRVNWFGPAQSPSVIVHRYTANKDGHFEITLLVDPAQVESVEVRPVRRPLLDTEGHVRDAQKIADDSSRPKPPDKSDQS